MSISFRYPDGKSLADKVAIYQWYDGLKTINQSKTFFTVLNLNGI